MRAISPMLRASLSGVNTRMVAGTEGAAGMEFITVEQQQRIGLVTFRRPEALNAWGAVL